MITKLATLLSTLLLLASIWIVRDALPHARAAQAALLGLLAALVITSLVGIGQVAYCAEWPAAAARAPGGAGETGKARGAGGLFRPRGRVDEEPGRRAPEVTGRARSTHHARSKEKPG